MKKQKNVKKIAALRQRSLRLSSARAGQARLRSATAGQAMLLTVVMTGSILFIITSVAGILMFYQLQQVTDISNSAAAIFAADAVLEKATYAYFTDPKYIYDQTVVPADMCFTVGCDGPSIPLLANGASGFSTILIEPPSPNSITTITAEGRGPGNRTVRLLQTKFLANPQ